ncbi:MAG TPA: hypothetical protein GX528_08430 [Firmicutes bacterium]|nr:hypothetical protein [Bacillota bacterium]
MRRTSNVVRAVVTGTYAVSVEGDDVGKGISCDRMGQAGFIANTGCGESHRACLAGR